MQAQFPNILVARLPHCYGPGLKKNFLFDLLHQSNFHLTDFRDVFQFYNVSNLWGDLSCLAARGYRLAHITAEPMTAAEVARECFGLEFTNVCQREPALYDLRTRYDYRNSGNCGYMYTRDEVIADIIRFKGSFST